MRKSRIILLTALGLLVFVGLPLLFLNPGVQIQIWVHADARNDDGFLVRTSWRFVGPYCDQAKPMPPSMIHALVEMLSDPDPRVRKKAVILIFNASELAENKKAFYASAGIQEKLKMLLNDPDPGTIQAALFYLGDMKGKENVPFFRRLLKTHLSNEAVCCGALMGLSDSDDPQLLDDILPFANDSRTSVATTAIYDLGDYDDPRALDIIAKSLPSLAYSHTAVSAFNNFQIRFPNRDVSAQMDPALLAASHNKALGTSHRVVLPPLIKDKDMQIEAWKSLLLSPSTDHDPSECQRMALGGLYRMGPSAISVAPVLEKIIDDPATHPWVRSAAVDTLKKIRP